MRVLKQIEIHQKKKNGHRVIIGHEENQAQDNISILFSLKYLRKRVNCPKMIWI